MRFSIVILRTAVGILCISTASAKSRESSWCGTLMCVTATTSGNTITYELQALNQLGWMSIGFGAQMNSTPLVVMWPNADGSVTLSQRQASGHSQPVPVASPSRVATVSTHTDLSSETSPVLAFDIPQLEGEDDLDETTMIWAFGVERPDSDPDADIVQHLDAGPFVLEARKHGDDSDDTSSAVSPGNKATQSASAPTSSASLTSHPAPTSVSPSPSSSSDSSPSSSASSDSSLSSLGSLLPSSSTSSSLSSSPTQLSDSAPHVSTSHVHSLSIAHASLSFLGFAFFLPLSSLFARWSRTFINRWHRIHWLIVVMLALPCMAVGWVLGPLLVSRNGHHHVVNEHQICGVALFALCLIQMSLGALAHLQQPKDGNAHPPRNVFHVALGLFVVGFAFFETKTGITRDWTLSPDTKKILTILCILWAIVVAVAYLIGLTFLRKQFDQERLGWHLPLASHTRPLRPISDRSTNHASSSSAGHSNGGLLRWMHSSRTEDGHHGTHSSFSHQSTVSSSDRSPEVRAEASVVTLVEMREVQSMLPISVRARDTLPCSAFVEQSGMPGGAVNFGPPSI